MGGKGEWEKEIIGLRDEEAKGLREEAFWQAIFCNFGLE
jgi:hypothetical protein